MNLRTALLFSCFTFCVSSSVYAFDSEDICISESTTIEAKLHCLQDLSSITELPATGLSAGLKKFELKFSQPVDHEHPDDGKFSQRLVLLHRSEVEPMVLHTSGYSIFNIRESAITSMFATNQLQVEHRFFSDSVPEPKDWAKLNIKQSADDFHRITVAFKKIYGKHWVNTGASKGGMTSIYHRRFYPADLDGTVADVAPLSFSTSDERYIQFVDQVGGEVYADCRQKIKDLQFTLLLNRDELVPTLSGNFEFLGSADLAFEHAVIEAGFIYWQYSNPLDPVVGCDKIPQSSLSEMLAFLEKINSLTSYVDDGVLPFLPYYFQAATELGNPGNLTLHLEDLRRYPFTIDQYTPKGVTYSYSNAGMEDVRHWVETESERILFVYGELDPWSAGAFPIRDAEHETYKLYVKGGNHSAKFVGLSGDDRSTAIAAISKWLDKAPSQSKAKKNSKSLEDLDFETRKALRLP